MFPLCSQLLGSGPWCGSDERAGTVTSGERGGERRHDRHQEILVSFPTLTLLFANVGGIWAFLTGAKCENKHPSLTASLLVMLPVSEAAFAQSVGWKGSAAASWRGQRWSQAKVSVQVWTCCAQPLLEGTTVEIPSHLTLSMVLLHGLAGDQYDFGAALMFPTWSIQAPRVAAASHRVEREGFLLGCLSKPSLLRCRNQGRMVVECFVLFIFFCFHIWKCKISFWATAFRQLLPEAVNTVEEMQWTNCCFGIFCQLEEKPQVDFSPTLTTSCLLREGVLG